MQTRDIEVWTEYTIEETLSEKDVRELEGKDVYCISAEGPGFLMENLYLRSTRPTLKKVEKFPSGLFCFHIRNGEFVYLKTGRVVVWK